jgi:L-ribulokinase
MYRALIEATAYGTRMIIETFREYGVGVDTFYAAGGISQKDPMMMQNYADVIRMPIKIAGPNKAAPSVRPSSARWRPAKPRAVRRCV